VTTVADDLIGLAHDADILIHEVADLGYLERHGMAGEALQRMAALHPALRKSGRRRTRRSPRTDPPSLPARRAGRAWERRARHSFSGKTTAGRDGLRLTLAACGHDHLPNGAADS